MKKLDTDLTVTFIKSIQREKIYYNKRLLKCSGVTITENLNTLRNSFYKTIKSKGLTCWTSNGNILVLQNDKKIILKNLSDMQNIIQTLVDCVLFLFIF